MPRPPLAAAVSVEYRKPERDGSERTLTTRIEDLLHIGANVQKLFERRTDVNSVYRASAMFRNDLLKLLQEINTVYGDMDAEIGKAVALYEALNAQSLMKNASSYHAVEEILLQLVTENKKNAEHSGQLANTDAVRAVGGRHWRQWSSERRRP